MSARVIGLLVVILPLAGWAEEVTANQVMARVAANQERAEELRKTYVYQQEIRARVLKGSINLVREESRRYVVTPTDTGTKREQTSFLGRIRLNKKLLEYHDDDYKPKNLDLDGDLAEAFSEWIVEDGDNKDGIGQKWFPLTGREQLRYRFQLSGTEEYRGRSVYRITFEPKKRSNLLNNDTGTWKGEVLVDEKQFQPVLVVTELAKGVPMWARVVFGTNVKQMGFKMAYEEFADGVWFPVSYGGEFKIRAVFFYARTIALSMVNSGFQRAEVTSHVEFSDP